MPVIGDVFGLNSVYEKQVANIESNNLASWPESATYGYFGGGLSPTGPNSTTLTVNTLRLDFSNNIITNPGISIFPSSRMNYGTSSNSSHGYLVGGSQSVYSSFVNTTSRFNFDTEVSVTPGNNLSSSRNNLTGTGNDRYAYFGGGYSTPVAITYNRIARIDYTTDNLQDYANIMPTNIQQCASVKTNLYGYFCGGWTGSSYLSTVTRLDFSTFMRSNPGKNLPYAINNISGLSNENFGYLGGYNMNFQLRKFDFSNENVTAISSGIHTTYSYPAAVSSNIFGYFAGGQGNPSLNSISTISRLEFSTETTSTSGFLPVPLQGFQGFSAGISNSTGLSIYKRKKSKTYGYYAGGQTPSTISNITRLDFSNETVSNPGKNLPTARSRLAGISNNYYGYFGGGFAPPYINTITRLDFSNETVSNPGKNLPTARNGLSAVSSNSYGYFGGGFAPPFTNTITRLDFSNETLSDPGNNLPTERNRLSAISNNYYGYFGGGNTSLNYSTITRLDFSNETVSDPGNNLPTARTELGSVSSSSYGYFGGGYSTSFINTITRFDFSNETVSGPGKNLPSIRDSLSAVSSSFYGYFGGGEIATTPTNINTITRLDFSNETVSNPGNNLPTERSGLSAVSNSN
jgi:hypothetical protein